MDDLYPLAPGVGPKLERAAELLNQLDNEVLTYLADRPFRFDVELLRSELRYSVTARVDPPPRRLSVIFGEVLHNLRSSLDYLARALVIAAGNAPVDGGPGSTAFPILKARRKEMVDIAPGVHLAARDALDGIQPYQDAQPELNPLWRLLELSNADKHRLLSVTSLAGNGGAAFVPAPLDPERATTQEQRRHVVRLVPDVPQFFDVTPDEVFEPAALAGMWGYTVALNEAGASRHNQLVGVGRGIAIHIVEKVLPEFEDFLNSAS